MEDAAEDRHTRGRALELLPVVATREPVEQTPQQPLALAVAPLHAWRQRPGELRRDVVEQRQIPAPERLLTWLKHSNPLRTAKQFPRVALLGRTVGDVRGVMVDGKSGLLARGHPDLDGLTVNRPGEALASTLLAWLGDGAAVQYVEEGQLADLERLIGETAAGDDEKARTLRDRILGEMNVTALEHLRREQAAQVLARLVAFVETNKAQS